MRQRGILERFNIVPVGDLGGLWENRQTLASTIFFRIFSCRHPMLPVLLELSSAYLKACQSLQKGMRISRSSAVIVLPTLTYIIVKIPDENESKLAEPTCDEQQPCDES